MPGLGDGGKEVLFPLADVEMASEFDTDLKIPSTPPPGLLGGKLRKYEKGFSPTTTGLSDSEPLPLYSSSAGVLKKGRRQSSKNRARGGFRKKEVVKFRPLDEVSDDSSDEDSRPAGLGLGPRPWLRSMSSAASSTPTLVDSPNKSQSKSTTGTGAIDRDEDELDYDKEVGRLKAVMKRRGTGTGVAASPGLSDTPTGPPDYSDFEDEEDIVSASTKEEKEGKEWTPGFLKRHRSSASASRSVSGSSNNPSNNPHSLTSSNSNSNPPAVVTASPLTSPPLASMPLAPVPATPSLLLALDRVEKARREAFTTTGLPVSTAISNSNSNSNSHKDDKEGVDTDVDME
jgi:hypothetical protein